MSGPTRAVYSVLGKAVMVALASAGVAAFNIANGAPMSSQIVVAAVIACTLGAVVVFGIGPQVWGEQA